MPALFSNCGHGCGSPGFFQVIVGITRPTFEFAFCNCRVTARHSWQAKVGIIRYLAVLDTGTRAVVSGSERKPVVRAKRWPLHAERVHHS